MDDGANGAGGHGTTTVDRTAKDCGAHGGVGVAGLLAYGPAAAKSVSKSRQSWCGEVSQGL